MSEYKTNKKTNKQTNQNKPKQKSKQTNKQKTYIHTYIHTYTALQSNLSVRSNNNQISQRYEWIQSHKQHHDTGRGTSHAATSTTTTKVKIIK